MTVRALLIALLMVLAALPGAAWTAPSETSGPLVVSLTFDDGPADQLGYAASLAAHGLHGTFYVNSGTVGTPGYLSRTDLAWLAASGHEIGGHTVLHADLATVAVPEAAREICQDRATLAAWGLTPTSLAYPFGSRTPDVEAAARDCGYTSARTVGGLRPPPAPGAPCAQCAPTEGVVPADRYAVRTPGQVEGNTSADQLEGLVAAAEPSRGWLPLVFHHEGCGPSCGPLSTSTARFDEFLGWLAGRVAAGAVTVRTVGAVVGGPPRPVVAPPPGGGGTVPNPSLELARGDAGPDCWQAGGYGRNAATFTRVPVGRTGRWAEQVTVAPGYVDGDAKLLPRLDLGECAPAARGDTAYTLGAWYRSDARVQLSVYRRTATGRWDYWTTSPWFGAAADWAPATWTTPATPPDTTALAFGVALSSAGSVVTDDYSLTAAPGP